MATQPEKTKRRARGDGGLHWDEKRQRWIAELTVGYRPNGKRITRKASAATKTAAKDKLDELRNELRNGGVTPVGYSVSDAVTDWLRFGLNGRNKTTVAKLTTLADQHVTPDLGARKLADRGSARELTADDVDAWLARKAETLATRTLGDLRSILKRSIDRAQRRGKVQRNVVLLCDELPNGKEGRPSKSLTLAQAEALLDAAEKDDSTMGAYTIVSLLTGARTEEARPLLWPYVELRGSPDAVPPVPPHINVWRSVREKGETKTKKSRRSLALPARAVAALTQQHGRQANQRAAAGVRWRESGLVFASAVGTEISAANVRRGFRRIVRLAELNEDEWTPRELRHSFVSLLSDSGVTLEQIARLVGHAGTSVTEAVYYHQLRPVIQDGALAMDTIFPTAAPPAANR